MAGVNKEGKGIPEEIKSTIDKMRDLIDNTSQLLIDSGAISGELIGKVQENMKTYLYRGYKLFHDPSWTIDKVPVEDMEAARSFYRNEILKTAEGKTLTEEGLQDRIDGMVKEVFDNPDFEAFAQGKAGSKNIDILKKRKEVPREIRALMGEIKDPRANFMNSILRMGALLANQDFLNGLKKIGIEDGWLSEKQTGQNARQYSSDKSRTTDPLNGMYIDPKMDDALKDMYSPKNTAEWHRQLLQLTGFAKVMKTAGSFSSQIRNVISNQLFMLAGGYYNKKAWGSAFKEIAFDLGINKGGTDINQDVLRQNLSYYADLGLIDDSINIGEVSNILKESNQRYESTQENTDFLLWRGIKKGYNKALEFYGAGDDVFKIIAFKVEKQRYEKLAKDYNDPDLMKSDRELAEIVTNNMPSYSKTPKFVDVIRKIPIVGTFPSFPAEVIRTTANNIALAKEEMSSKNEGVRAIGRGRALRLAAAFSTPVAIKMAIQGLLGVDLTDEEEQDMRRGVPTWSKGSSIIWLGNPKDGVVNYIDTSFSDPYAVFKKPFTVMSNSEDIVSGTSDALIELASPFLGEDMVFQRVLDIYRNKKNDSNSPVYFDSDTTTDKVNKMKNHMIQVYEPGTITTAKRIYEAEAGIVNDAGGTRDPQIEYIAAFLGARISKLEAPKTLAFKVGSYKNARGDLKRSLSRDTFSKASHWDVDSMTEKWERFKAGNRIVFEQVVKDIKFARTMGMTEDQIFEVLRESKLSRNDAAAIISGEFIEPTMDKRLMIKLENLKSKK